MSDDEFVFDEPVLIAPDGRAVPPSQLTCTDQAWTPLAPLHHFVPFMAPDKEQTCRFCGKRKVE